MNTLKCCFLKIKKIDGRYSYFDVDRKGNGQIFFQNFYEQLKNQGLHWKSQHLHCKIQLLNDEKFITKTLTLPKLGWGIRSLFLEYNMIYFLRSNTVEKSAGWTEMYEFGLIVKKKLYQKCFSCQERNLKV